MRTPPKSPDEPPENGGEPEKLDLSRPRVIVPPKATIIKPRDPINIADFALDLNQLESSVSAMPLGITCNRPGKTDWFHTCPDKHFRATVSCILHKSATSSGATDVYLVHPCMVEQLQDDIVPCTIFLLFMRSEVYRLCEVVQPGPDGKWNEYHRTRQLALERGMAGWVRMWVNKAAGRYEWKPPPYQYPVPNWPDPNEISMADFLTIAFRDTGRLIDSVEHPLAKILIGLL